jgi:Protein of unknown function (DUF998)
MNSSIAPRKLSNTQVLPQLKTSNPFNKMVLKGLLMCGIISSVLYVVMNVVAAILYEGYSSVSQTVSELSAIDAPTRTLWVSLAVVYSLLVIAFGFGVWQSSLANKPLKITGLLLIVDAIIGLFWPPMHQREVLAAGDGSLTDTMHIIFTFVTVPLIMLTIGFGAVALGKRFRQYSIITLMILIFAGVLTGLESPNISKDLPTPWIGVWERINIGVYMLWVAVLASSLLHKTESRSIKYNIINFVS